MDNNRPYIGLALAIFSVVCGTLGIILVCVGTIAIPTSILAEEQINFLGNNDAQAALTAGIAALVLGLGFVALPAYYLVNLITKRSEERVIDQYSAYDPDLE